MAQVLSAGADLNEMAFHSALTPHPSGARVLAAPPEFMPLESLTAGSIDALLGALRRDFDLVILDLPIVWTAWTYRALRQSDHIVLITQLSVPHAHLAKRQLQLLDTQRLDDIPLTLVCNRAGGDNPTGVSVRSVEAAIGRKFDVVAPEERRLMNEAINQGVALSTIRRGSKLERSVEQLAALVSPGQASTSRNRRK
jgi:pilus assembly protein CpaE